MKSGPPGDPTDREIEAVLGAASTAAWTLLAEQVEAIESSATPYVWRGGRRDDGSLTLPFVEYAPVVSAAVQHLYDIGAVVAFDWMSWNASERFDDPTAFDSAPVADVVRWLTALVRSERFGDGSIAATLDDGTLVVALRRLLAWPPITVATPEDN